MTLNLGSSNGSGLLSIDLPLDARPSMCSETVLLVKEVPYHILTHKQKRRLVYIVSVAGMFSPLASNIYFPAVNTISHELHIEPSVVALTITVYMIVQGLAPSLWAPLSDGPWGRRLTFICTLSIFSIANLALAFTLNFPMLLVFRGLQAAGSAATISIGTGVIADIALPHERGSFIGTNSGIRMVAQALGPFFGGLLSGVAGFRSVFWLLFFLGIIVLLILVVFLPETQRSIAGNGSVPLHGIHRPLIHLYKQPNFGKADTEYEMLPEDPMSFKQMLVPFKALREKDILALLGWGAIVYTAWSMVTSSTATLLVREFPFLTDLQIGLCFLPNGVGCVLGSISIGKLTDYMYKRAEKQYKREQGIAPEVSIKGDCNFPYERARLASVPYFSAVFIVSVGLYGASYELNAINRFALANLLISMALQFFIAYTATALFSIYSTMLVDCFPQGAAGASALNNLARCTLGAVGVSVIQPLIDVMDIKFAYLLLAGIVLLFSPLVWIEWRWGQHWRMARENAKGKQPR